MPDSPYRNRSQEDLILRDHLAIDRTVLANERTLLAYVRTALGFIVLGLTLLNFLKQQVYQWAGAGGIAFGTLVFLIGIVRYVQMRRELARIRDASRK